MVNDPYKVLGVSQSASQDEIKSAYRKMAKMYHPDLHPDDPNAAIKMNEINEAYDMLTHPEKYERRRAQEANRNAYRSYTSYGNSNGNSQSNGYGNYGYQGTGGWYSDFNGFDFDEFFGFGRYANSQYQSSVNINPTVEPSDSETVKSAINNINSGHYQEAFRLLMQVPHSGRNARWYYLNALTLYGYGDVSQAAEYIRSAVEMDPSNETYKELYRKFESENRTYYRSGPVVLNPIRMVGRIILFIFLIRIFFSFLRLILGMASMAFLPPM